MNKLTHILFTLALIFITLSAQAQSKSVSISKKKIEVGVFDGHGGAQSCIWETVAALRLDPDMNVRTITTSDIANGALQSLDAIIIPGGGGSRQFLNLGAENHRRIKAFVESGKGAVGICAGAYLFSSTPDYACLWLNGAKAIDREHDNRGHGIAKMTLTEEGAALFPELASRDTCYIMYYEGPVFIKNRDDKTEYQTLAMMNSDVHEEGDAPANMTNDRPFFIANSYGKGRVFSSIAHPEGTHGMMWMIPRMVRWTLNMPIVPYKKEVVNPDIFNKEILMTVADLKKESSFYNIFLYGTPQEKIAALDWLQERHSWDAKRWVQGLLYDGDANVRIRAAKYISDTMYLKYLPDLKAAYNTEKFVSVKNELKIYLDKLSGLLP